jgi:hypothetical protein
MTDRSPTLSAPAVASGPDTSVDQQDRDWETVRGALADSRWRFRSVEGIVAATGLEPDDVQRTLHTHRNEVRAILARSRNFRGVRQVYTLATRPRTFREIAADIFAFASR